MYNIIDFNNTFKFLAIFRVNCNCSILK